jgi:hypothetical protein
MNKGLLIAFFLIGQLQLIEAQNSMNVDVCIYGGTSAGIIAAYTAKTYGKSVVLIEPGNHLGGMTTGGLGFTDIGNKYAVTGLARDFYRRIGDHYGKFEQWIFEPHVASKVFGDYIKKADVEIHRHTNLKDVAKTEDRIEYATFVESDDSVSSEIRIYAKVFIDCSYEGDLMAMAKVSYRIGREENKEFDESLNGVQLLDAHQFPDKIDPYRIPGKKESGLLWGINNDSLKAQGSGDDKIQAYNFRICLSSVPENMIPIARPRGYDSMMYQLLPRLFAAFPEKRKLNDYFIWSRMPEHKTDINNRGAFSTDMIGMNYHYPEASYAERQTIVKQHEVYTKGLLYFFGHDEHVPEQLRKEMSMWGYPKDEYTDNGNWSPQLYIREARRMRGEYVMTQQNCVGKRKVNDGIALAAYTMDSHNCERLVVNGFVKNEGNVEVGGFGPYPISYRAITPQKQDASNLIVPVCLSATHIAYGSIRMEPVFMVLAQAAAVAAVMAIDDESSVQDINIRKLQEELKVNPHADGSLPDILVDGDESRHLKFSGKKWSKHNGNGYGAGFFTHIPNDKKPGSARFNAPEMKRGQYNLFLYLPDVEGVSEFITVNVSDGIKTIQRIVNTKRIVVEGQTSGEWVSLGCYRVEEGKKPYVEITEVNATGLIVADAVLWVPLPCEN